MHFTQALLLSVLDVVEVQGGQVFHVWAIDHLGRRALLRVPDFQPYLYLTAPCTVQENSHCTSLHTMLSVNTLPHTLPSTLHVNVLHYHHPSTNQEGDREGANAPIPLTPPRLQALIAALNRQLPADLHVTGIVNVAKRPIMYFRPRNQQPTPMLKVCKSANMSSAPNNSLLCV